MLQREERVLMFELRPTPPISPISDAMVVPQMSHGRSEYTGSRGASPDDALFDQPIWSDIYDLMADLPGLTPNDPDAKASTRMRLPSTQFTPATSPLTDDTEAHSAVLTEGLMEDDETEDLMEEDETQATHELLMPFVVTSPASPPCVTLDRLERLTPSPSKHNGPARGGSARIKARRVNTTLSTTAGKQPRKIPVGKIQRRRTSSSKAILPADHKPARGRGRQLQLATMTEAMKKAEAKERLEKNRQAAREFRVRRKEHVVELEQEISVFEARDQAQSQEISKLHAQVAKLQAQLAQAQRR